MDNFGKYETWLSEGSKTNVFEVLCDSLNRILKKLTLFDDQI